MSDPTVSVLLTSYNQGQWLREAIESVLAQTYQAWELLIVDNGSTDDSPAIVAEYQVDPRIRVMRYEHNLPHTMISNAGIAMSRGHYISLLYGDDYYLPEKLERQVAAFEGLSAEYGVIYSGGHVLRQDGKLYEAPCGRYQGNVLEALIAQPKLFLPISPLIRRECFLCYPFNERIFMEGEGIFNKFAFRYLFHPLPEPLVVMRDHRSNLGKEIRRNVERNVLMYEEIFGHPEFPGELKHYRGVALGKTYRLGGWELIRREGDYRKGREWLRQAIRHNHRLLRDPRVIVGLCMSSLPRLLAHACNAMMNLVMGAPVPAYHAPVVVAQQNPVPKSNNVGLFPDDQGHSVHTSQRPVTDRTGVEPVPPIKGSARINMS